MKHLLSCEFNLDTACVELCFSDGSMVSIDTIAVENEVVNNMYQQSELDYLIYNDPAAYADLILNGDPAVYLKTVTEYQPYHSAGQLLFDHSGVHKKVTLYSGELEDQS